MLPIATSQRGEIAYRPIHELGFSLLRAPGQHIFRIGSYEWRQSRVCDNRLIYSVPVFRGFKALINPRDFIKDMNRPGPDQASGLGVSLTDRTDDVMLKRVPGNKNLHSVVVCGN